MRKWGTRAAGILLAVMVAGWASSAIGAETRSYTQNNFALELDGGTAGFIAGFEGGVPYGEIVEQSTGQDRIVRKTVGPLKYEEITITAPLGMENNFLQWIQETIAGKAQPRNGAIVTYDFQSKEATRMEFLGAFISEITLPKVELTVRTPAYLTVKIRPQYTRYVAPRTGNKGPASSKGRTSTTSSNFRLRIDGLEQATTNASSVDAVTFKVEIAQNLAGEGRLQTLTPGKIWISNLAVTTRVAKPVYDWADFFLLRGNRNAVKNGTLEYMDATGTKTVMTVTFRNLGIVKVSPVAVRTGAGAATGGVKAEMYCNEISIGANAGK